MTPQGGALFRKHLPLGCPDEKEATIRPADVEVGAALHKQSSGRSKNTEYPFMIE